MSTLLLACKYPHCCVPKLLETVASLCFFSLTVRTVQNCSREISLVCVSAMKLRETLRFTSVPHFKGYHRGQMSAIWQNVPLHYFREFQNQGEVAKQMIIWGSIVNLQPTAGIKMILKYAKPYHAICTSHSSKSHSPWTIPLPPLPFQGTWLLCTQSEKQ